MSDWQFPDYPWRLWRSYRGMRSLAGDFKTRSEAERAILQLLKLQPNSTFEIEFVGRSISHCDQGGKPID